MEAASTATSHGCERVETGISTTTTSRALAWARTSRTTETNPYKNGTRNSDVLRINHATATSASTYA